MNLHAGKTEHTRRRRTAGFSLIELMVVVAITSVLAAIAIPTFSGYIHKSRTSEATGFLGEIKLREESFRSEFGAYTATNFDTTNFAMVPAAVPGPDPVNWPAGGVFDTIGARPDGQVRFSYGVIAGLPATAPSAPWNFDTRPDHWFVARAVGNLDGDGVQCTFEVNNYNRAVWFTPAKGWE